MKYEPGFEPFVGIVASAAGLASSFWPNIRSFNYEKKRLSGIVSFDYSNNNGCFKIGAEEMLFETMWSKGSDTSIHIYSDPPSIESVAVATKIAVIENVIDASKYDGSSRSRTLHEGEVAILKNKYGNYAALQIVDIKDNTRSDDKDELTFRYVLNPNGFASFKSKS